MFSKISTLVSAALYVASSYAQTTDSLGNVTVVGINAYGGSGCPQGTLPVIYPYKNNPNVFYTKFTQFNASIGPSVSVASSRANCQLNINFQYPAGLQFAPKAANFKGYAKIGSGVSATLKSTYYFSGSETQSSTQQDFTGPLSSDYYIKDQYPEYLTWSPCGATSVPLNVNTQVRLSSTDAAGAGYVTATELLIADLYWKKCA
ncbi:hypothetical protein B0J14DRAFT_206853 [Halenospora varia]|nr:hypothetical protein B0J14DRAFT_206853 [Halenospora varia]